MSGMPEIGSFVSKLNRGALSTLEGVTGGFFVPPAAHRFKVIAYSVLATAGAMGIKNVVEGRRNDGSELKADDVPFFVRPLHGTLANNPFSSDPEDRWKKVIANSIPVMACMAGAYFGSWDYAHNTVATKENMATAKRVMDTIAKETNASVHLADASVAFSNMGADFVRFFSAFFQAFGFHSGLAPANGMALGHAFSGPNDNALAGAFKGPLQAIGRFISGSTGSVAGLRKASVQFGQVHGKTMGYRAVEDLLMRADELNLSPEMRERLQAFTSTERFKVSSRKVDGANMVSEMEAHLSGFMGRYFADIGSEFKGFMHAIAEELHTAAHYKVKNELTGDKVAAIFSKLGGEHQVTPEMFQQHMEGMVSSYLKEQKLDKDLANVMKRAGIKETDFGVGKAGLFPRFMAWVKGTDTKKMNDAIVRWYNAETPAIGAGV